MDNKDNFFYRPRANVVIVVVKKERIMNEIGLSLDTVWMLLAAMLVFWMQPGFALCEAGFTRSKNTANILMKNFVDFMFGSLLFFFLGFGFMFGGDVLEVSSAHPTGAT